MVWRELTNHVGNCYFCKKKESMQYPCIPSAILPILEPPPNYEIKKDNSEEEKVVIFLLINVGFSFINYIY